MRYIVNSISLFIHSNQNIVGCICASIGLVLYFTGIIYENWLPIVVALYVFGYRITPPPPKIVEEYDGLLSSVELLISLSRLVKKVDKRIPVEMMKLVLAIKTDLESIVRRYDDLKHDINRRYIVQQIVVDYLPKILETFLKIPPVYRKIYPSMTADSPEAIAIVQLELLKNQTKKISKIITDHNTTELRTHYRFLKSKFAD